MRAITIPSQKLFRGRKLRKIKEKIPTQIGERLVNKVACVAVEFCMEIFQTAISEANKIPQTKIGKSTFKFSTFSFFR